MAIDEKRKIEAELTDLNGNVICRLYYPIDKEEKKVMDSINEIRNNPEILFKNIKVDSVKLFLFISQSLNLHEKIMNGGNVKIHNYSYSLVQNLHKYLSQEVNKKTALVNKLLEKL
jgi:hypothetical protein